MTLIKNLLPALLGILVLLPMSVVGILANLVISIRDNKLNKTTKRVKDTVKFGLISGYDFLLGILNSIGMYTSVFLNITSGLLIREVFTYKIDEEHLYGKVGITTSMALGKSKEENEINSRGNLLLWAIEKILINDNHFEESYSKFKESGKVSGFKG